MKSIIIIPARLQSSRLPRKLLLRETGKSLIQHTYESAGTSSKAELVIVAADHHEIFDEVSRFGGQVVMTSADHPCGTDRVAEVATASPEFEIIVNVQGDEPEISGEAIDLAIEILEQNPDAKMATLATPIRDRSLLNDPGCVKVVTNSDGEAMYFSRSPIPMARDWNDELLNATPPNFLQHVGLYAYRREFLLEIPTMAKPTLESIESLEQLRVLHSGTPIHVGLIDHPLVGIDTPNDYAAFVSRQSNR